MLPYQIPRLAELDPVRFDRIDILKSLASSSRQLAELKGVAATIPNQAILINSLVMREAQTSSEIENIVTTQDEVFKGDLVPEDELNSANKEVKRYRQALVSSFHAVRNTGLITERHIREIQSELKQSHAGYRRLPGTQITNETTGVPIYSPPQTLGEIETHMIELERFCNEDALMPVDPLIKMALIHHQFESIHPFYDGNGRTGRILNVLYLMRTGLLDLPILYLSGYIVRHKSDYYRLLQEVRDKDNWEDWVMYMLDCVEITAGQAIELIKRIRILLQRYKTEIRSSMKFYSQDLINNLFAHPYTKIAFIERDLGVTRVTAARYLDELTEAGFLQKQKAGRANFYLNAELIDVLRD